ncbi:MAG: radical SAM protein, partial [Chloroflexi bacterium]|nr:radical SAM protein [Chloroflexota bacterium]
MTAPPAGWAVGTPRPRPAPGDLNRDPFIIFWELTRACALACRHCRAEAQPQRHPLELTTAECFALVEALTHFDQPPIVILSGGDPFMRRDLFDIVGHARKLGLTVAVAPSATALVTEQRLSHLVELGVSSISLSLDGAGPQVHDAFRGFAGTFDRTIRIAETARRLGLPFQINTAVSRHTWRDLSLMATVVEEIGASTWDLFFLVPTGRAAVEDMLTPEEHEHVFEWVLD